MALLFYLHYVFDKFKNAEWKTIPTASIVKDLCLVIIGSHDIINVSVTLLKLMKEYKSSREGGCPDEETPSSSRAVTSRTSNMKNRSLRLATATNAHHERHLATKNEIGIGRFPAVKHIVGCAQKRGLHVPRHAK